MPAFSVWGPWALAAALFLGLMFSFLNVVQQGVARAEQQHRLAIDQMRAEQHCQAESTQGQRRACVADLKTAAALAALR